jgi:integrase
VNLVDARTKIKFTDTRIAKLDPPTKAGQKDRFYFDAGMPNLGVRVSARSRRFVFQRRAGDGSHYRQTLGKFPALNVVEARKLAKELSVKLDKGIDLRAKRAGRKARRDQAVADADFTLERLLGDWIEVHRPLRRPSYVNRMEDAVRRIFASLCAEPAASITNAQIETCLKPFTDRPAAGRAAGEMIQTLRKWGGRKGKLSFDSTKQLDLPEKSKMRQHCPTGEEARAIFRAARSLSPRLATYVRALQGTLVRRSEMANARRRQFSPDWSEWTVPGEIMKEGETHVVWVPPVLRKMLAELPQFKDSDLLFSADGLKPLTGFSSLKKQLDKALKDSGVRPFTLHDFRRSGTTWLVRNGTDPIVADRLLAHAGLEKIGPSAANYMTYRHENERRIAIERWVDYLAGAEAEVSPDPSPPLLPAPLHGTVIPPDTSRPRTLPVTMTTVNLPPVDLSQAEEREGQISETAFRVVMAITTHLEFVRAAKEILEKGKLAPAFKKEHPDATLSTALEILIQTAATLVLNREGAAKRAAVEAEQEKWDERTRGYRDAAEIARGSAKRKLAEALGTRAGGDEDRALQLESEAAELERRAEGYDSDAALSEQMTSIDPDDSRVFTYLPGDEQAKLAKGVLLGMKRKNKEIFGGEWPKWAAMFATAAAGRVVTPNQGRRPRRRLNPRKHEARDTA